MSGEMNTSLGNGWIAHMVVRFLTWKLYGKEPVVLQEGDDTVFCMPGVVGDELFSQLGLEVKLDRVPSVEKAQFCQLLFAPEDKIVVRDPVYYLVGFSWVPVNYMETTKYDRVLLASKAMSCAAQYPRHPLLTSFSRWILRTLSDVTPDVIKKFLTSRANYDSYKTVEMIKALELHESGGFDVRDPLPATRHLIEMLYNISLEAQLEIETWFDQQDELCPIPFDILFDYLDSSWIEYHNWYVRDIDCRERGVHSMQAVGPV